MKRNLSKKVVAAFTFLLVLGAGNGLLASCGGTSSASSITVPTISISSKDLTMYISDSQRLDYTVTDENALITWTSSDAAVATVKRGTVTAKGVGTATISGAIENGNTATVAITVLDRTVTISQSTATIDLDTANLTVQLTATASDSGDVTWSTSDSSIATVENGLVTGIDVGTATITASRGASKAECVVTVVKPSRPADYYKLTKLTNADCVADPGTWHYHVDGSLNSDYSFVEDPLHQSNSLSVTLGNLNLANKKYFYFRYQPTYDIGKLYTTSCTIESTKDMKINYSDGKNATKAKTLTANTPISITYVGEMNSSQPFHISIASCESLDNSQPTTLTVTDISFQEGDTTGGEITDIPQESEHAKESQYDLEIMTNSNVVLNTGAWYYSCDGTPNVDYTFAETPNYNNGVVNFSFSNIAGQKPYNQIRYQPTLDVGKYYKISFTANVTAAGSITYGTKVDSEHLNYVKNDVEAGTYNYEFTDQVNANFPFSIGVVPIDWNSPIGLVVSNITVVETQAPVKDGYEVKKGTKSETLAEPGKWFYFADGTAGTDYTLASTPMFGDGAATLSFTNLSGKKATNQLRYQPDLEVGKKYKIALTVTSSAECSVTYGSEVGATKNYATISLKADESQTIEHSSTVDSAVPFSLGIKPADYDAPITLKVSAITVSEVTGVSYDLEWGNKSTTIANPDKWYYMCDGTVGTDYSFVDGQVPNYDDNVVTLPLNKMTSGKTYQLRYQPKLDANVKYTATMNVTVSTPGKIIYGIDGATTTLEMTASTSTSITYSGTVSSSNPFFIQVKPTDYSLPCTMVVDSIVFTAI